MALWMYLILWINEVLSSSIPYTFEKKRYSSQPIVKTTCYSFNYLQIFKFQFWKIEFFYNVHLYDIIIGKYLKHGMI